MGPLVKIEHLTIHGLELVIEPSRTIRVSAAVSMRIGSQKSPELLHWPE
jgi:hypothetical protein